MVNVNFKDLLISSRLNLLAKQPFGVFCVDNFLPERVYSALLQSFPKDERLFKGRHNFKKKFISSSTHNEIFQNFCTEHPLWQQLVSAFRHPAFVSDLRKAVYEEILKARSFGAYKPWIYPSKAWHSKYYSYLRKMFFNPVSVNFQFSRLERGSYIPPHTDMPSKMVSLMLYFPDKIWKKAYGGGTEFYKPKKPFLEENWENKEIPVEELNVFAEAEFLPNRFVLFVKSKNSYHGVPPIKCPESIQRNSLNINLNIV